MELKPCPFCGSDRVYYTETDEQHYPDHECPCGKKPQDYEEAREALPF